jgi:phenylalanine-4-hydroxylase
MRLPREIRTMFVRRCAIPWTSRLEGHVAATHIFDAPPDGVAADWTMPQNWTAFTAEQHATWRTMFDQQSQALDGYACRSFLEGLDMLRQLKPGVPDFAELNALLKPSSGWEVVAVPGWIPNQPFFEHLANKRFPAANFVRPPEQIAYSEEPDMFHDIFGHVPMLADPAFSDFLVAYGEAGLRAEKLGASDCLGRLWLYTVELCRDFVGAHRDRAATHLARHRARDAHPL